MLSAFVENRIRTRKKPYAYLALSLSEMNRSNRSKPYENARLNESLRQMMAYCEGREHCLKQLLLAVLGQAAGQR